MVRTACDGSVCRTVVRRPAPPLADTHRTRSKEQFKRALISISFVGEGSQDLGDDYDDLEEVERIANHMFDSITTGNVFDSVDAGSGGFIDFPGFKAAFSPLYDFVGDFIGITGIAATEINALKGENSMLAGENAGLQDELQQLQHRLVTAEIQHESDTKILEDLARDEQEQMQRELDDAKAMARRGHHGVDEDQEEGGAQESQMGSVGSRSPKTDGDSSFNDDESDHPDLAIEIQLLWARAQKYVAQLKLDINVIFDGDEHRDALDEAFDPAKGSEGLGSMLRQLLLGFDSLANTTDLIAANAAREREEKKALVRAHGKLEEKLHDEQDQDEDLCARMKSGMSSKSSAIALLQTQARQLRHYFGLRHYFRL